MKDKDEKANFNMLEECTNEYSTKDLDNVEFEILIRIPARFRTIWLVKLTDLVTNLKEIESWKDE